MRTIIAFPFHEVVLTLAPVLIVELVLRVIGVAIIENTFAMVGFFFYSLFITSTGTKNLVAQLRVWMW